MQFKQTGAQVRRYYDGETETDILMKLIDSLRSEIEATKENQSKLNVAIAKVIGFIKRIELHAEDAAEDETDAGK